MRLLFATGQVGDTYLARLTAVIVAGLDAA
jgi:hypothetical protein